MANRYSPGSSCCDDCRVIDYLAPFTGFGTVEGETQTAGPYSFPSDNFDPLVTTDTVASRLVMAAADILGPSPAGLSTPNAYWHEIELNGDCDLTWEGGTIEYRPSAGTITAGGETVPILQDGSPATHSRLVLYVTPDWYAVMAFRQRAIPIQPFGTRVGSTRSSIQQFDRANDVTNTAATLTAGSTGATVFRWRLGDASVRLTDPAYGYAYGDIASQCFRPPFPMGTQTGYDFQTAAQDTGLFPGSFPATFSLIGDVIVDASQTYDCGSGPITESYNGPLAASIRTGSQFGFDWFWFDTLLGFYSLATPGVLSGPGLENFGRFGTIEVTCCPCPPLPDQSLYGGFVSFTAYLQTIWRFPTPEEPFPKIEQAAVLFATSNVDPTIEAKAITPYGPDGKAPATTQLAFINWQQTSNVYTDIESALVSWASA